MLRVANYEKDIVSRSRNETLLHRAVENDDLEVIIYSIKELKLDMNTKDNFNTSCYDLLSFMSTEVIIYFITNGHDIKQSRGYRLKKHFRNTTLFVYMLNNDIITIDEDTVKDIIFFGNLSLLKYVFTACGVSLANRRLLDIAFMIDDFDIVKFIIENGGRVYQNNFIQACKNHNKQLMKYLVEEQGMYFDNHSIIEINHAERDSIDKSFLRYAYDHRDFDRDDSLIYIACHLGETDVVDTLVRDYEYDIDKPDEFALRPVNYAILSGNIECVNHVINVLGASTKHLQIYDYIKSNSVDIIEKYINLNTIDKSAVYYMMNTIVETDNPELLQYFINRGFRLSQFHAENAIYENNLEIFKYIDKTVGFNRQQILSLINSGFYGKLDCLQYLVEKYNFSLENFRDCLFSLTHSDKYLDVFRYIVNLVGTSVLTMESNMNRTMYEAASNYNSYLLSSFIRECRGY